MIASTPFKHPVFTFGLPFEGKLNVKNRWVILANLIPWDKLADTYNDAMCANNGRLALPARLVLDALFAKHLLKVSDEETILQIQENVYLQYFIGLEVFQEAPIFDPSLFVAIRKRLGKDGVTAVENAIVDAMIADRTQGKVEQKNNEKPTDEPTKDEPTDDKPTDEPTKNEPTKNHSTKKQTNKKKVAKPKKATNIVLPPKKNLAHRGHLKIDTTVAPQKIKFPTNLYLLNTTRLS
jgi:transposase, IS5 family